MELKMKQRISMQVPPSTVLYTACAGDPGTEGVTEDSKLEEMAARLLANSDELTLQVVEKDGYYFTLNNTQLQVCQWLENRGRCSKVQLLMVPLKAVPDGIKQMMVAPRVKADETEKYMTITYEPMERRPRTARDDDDDNDDHSGSDDSDGYDSDSLCDEADIKEQQQRRRRQSEESGQEEDASLL